MDTVQHVVIFPRESIGTISPLLHGQFIEHIGTQITPGIYVGQHATMPQTCGIRNDVLSALQKIHPSVIRWPGGCFADIYHWRDGIGMQRNGQVNEQWGYLHEPNTFGTHEFMQLCRLLRTEPYIAANVGSGTVQEFHEWVKYCNTAVSTERSANGANHPFQVRYWGIGNEAWGCGGNMTPEEYAAQFMRFRSFAFQYGQTAVDAIAAGANHKDWEWTRRFFAAITSYGRRLQKVNGYAVHYYSGRAGTSTMFDTKQWLELLSKAAALDGIITGHRALIDEVDKERAVKLCIDEWGTWHPPEQGRPYRGLWQQNTMRDACVAAISLDVLHNHADTVMMANSAQMINVLQSLLLVSEQRCVKTPTYHVFDLYQLHKGARAVRFLSEAQEISDGESSSAWCQSCYRDGRAFRLRAIQGSASIRGQVMCITVVNASPVQAVEMHVAIHKYRVLTAEVSYLVSDDIHAYNSDEYPDRVVCSAAQKLRVYDRMLPVILPAASVARIVCTLSIDD